MIKLLILFLLFSTNCMAWTVTVQQIGTKGQKIDEYFYKVSSDKRNSMAPFSDLVCQTEPANNMNMWLTCQYKDQNSVGTIVAPIQDHAILDFYFNSKDMSKYIVLLSHN